MEQFERNVLGRWTPCRFPIPQEILRVLAETHMELVLIHPFRNGNRRVPRLLSTLMGLQGELPLLNFRVLTGERKHAYFGAIQVGMDTRYAPMEKLFGEIIAKSLSAS
jgi:cell filamentation protein